MAQMDKWIERFRIPAQDLNAAKGSAEKSEGARRSDEALRWCLMNGRIPENEYIEWAMREFELPSVNGDFFTAPPDHDFWKRINSVHSWSQSFFPLADWQGVLTIGCLQPPPPDAEFELRSATGERYKGTVKFVLASARNLLLLWNQLNAKLDIVAKLPQEPVKEKVKIFDPATSFDYSDEQLKKIVDGGSAGEPADDSDQFEMPDGFVLSPKKPGAVKAPKFEKAAAPMEFELPDGMNFGAAAKIPAKLPVVPDGLGSIDIPVLEATGSGLRTLLDENENDVSAVSVVNFTNDLATLATYDLNPVTTAAPEPVADDETGHDNYSHTPSDQSAASLNASSEPPAEPSDEPHAFDERTSFTLSGVETRDPSSATSIEDLGAICLVHMLEKFDGAMVLLMDGKNVKPWKWSDVLTTDKNANYPVIDLSTASIFRIVATTRLPYHGYVTPSPVNAAFFGAYFAGKIPKHVTITPIVVERKLVGMLMGVTRKELAYKGVLTQVEELTVKAAMQFARFRKIEAA